MVFEAIADFIYQYIVYPINPIKMVTILIAYFFFRQPLDHPDITMTLPREEGQRLDGGVTPFATGTDSYSHDGNCYCFPIHWHPGLEDREIDTDAGRMTVGEACRRAGKGPGPTGNPLYNDVQCGNTPVGSDDEILCPGRVDHGDEGCNWIGPKWNLN